MSSAVRCFLDNKVLLPFSRIVSHSYGFRHERRQGIMVAMPVRYDYERHDWTEKTVGKGVAAVRMTCCSVWRDGLIDERFGGADGLRAARFSASESKLYV
jgi:hypothetical protein